MSNIELVIKIDEDDVHRIVSGFAKEDDAILFAGLLQKGIPLPKGHGRIVDIGPYEGKVIASRKYCGVNKLVEVAELDTLIEADNTEREN